MIMGYQKITKNLKNHSKIIKRQLHFKIIKKHPIGNLRNFGNLGNYQI